MIDIETIKSVSELDHGLTVDEYLIEKFTSDVKSYFLEENGNLRKIDQQFLDSLAKLYNNFAPYYKDKDKDSKIDFQADFLCAANSSLHSLMNFILDACKIKDNATRDLHKSDFVALQKHFINNANLGSPQPLNMLRFQIPLEASPKSVSEPPVFCMK